MMKNDMRSNTGRISRPLRVHAAALGLAVALLATACGGSSATPPPPSGTLTLSTVRAFAALSFSSPVDLVQAPGDNSRWFVVEQGGTVRTFANQDTVGNSSVVIDIHAEVTSAPGGGETGLLGLAFHPGFPATDQRAYLYYTATVNGQLESRLSEFHTTDAGMTLDPTSEVILLTVTQPEANHNGGRLQFGPDGFLYLGLGDGGGGGDAHGTIGNGQDMNTLLGKILRIDVDHAAPYAIPPTGNPNAGNALCGNGGTGTAPCPEIYASGVRNPWKFSFDRTGGALWIGDVGQDSWEEVDRISAAANLGWRCREGAHAFNATCGGATNLTDPVAEYAHPLGEAITGGFVYRGSQYPALKGRYVFADYITKLLFNIDAATPSGSTLEVTAGDTSGSVSPVAFAEDQAGELYVLDYGGGVYRINAM